MFVAAFDDDDAPPPTARTDPAASADHASRGGRRRPRPATPHTDPPVSDRKHPAHARDRHPVPRHPSPRRDPPARDSGCGGRTTPPTIDALLVRLAPDADARLIVQRLTPGRHSTPRHHRRGHVRYHPRRRPDARGGRALRSVPVAAFDVRVCRVEEPMTLTRPGCATRSRVLPRQGGGYALLYLRTAIPRAARQGSPGGAGRGGLRRPQLPPARLRPRA